MYILTNGKDVDGQSRKIKTSALHIWLFGIELIDTCIIFTKQKIYFIMSKKKFQYLAHFKKNSLFNEMNIQFIEKIKENQPLLREIFEENSNTIKTISYLTKETQIGDLAKDVQAVLSEKQFNEIDGGHLIQQCLYLKDEKEIKNVENSSKITIYFYKQLLNEIKSIIDDDSKVKHIDISAKIQKIVDTEKKMNVICQKYCIEQNYVELAYSPIIQSGGQYDLRLMAESNSSHLQFDNIIISCGMKYISYHSQVIRTILISPDKIVENAYKTCEKIFEYMSKNIKPGKKLCNIYTKAVEIAKAGDLTKVPQNFGFGMGLEFREAYLLINENNEKQVEEGMVFNINIAFDNLKNEKDKVFAIQISDTVIVKAQQIENIVLTNGAPRNYKYISFILNEDEDGSESQSYNEEISEVQENYEEPTNKGSSRYNTRNRSNANQKKVQQNLKEEQDQNDNQRKLAQKKQEELKQRLENNGFNANQKQQKHIILDNFQSYKQKQDISDEFKPNLFQVDLKKLAVLIPIRNYLVPFNGYLVKSFARVQDNLRINFQTPHNLTNQKLEFPTIEGRVCYIKEITIQIKNQGSIDDLIKKLKEMQQKIKSKDLERSTKLEVEQEKVQLNKGKRPVLKDLKVRPPISLKKVSGNLECHLNGFRYQTNKGDTIEIAFSNIKHSFHQPSTNDIIIIIHFNLFHPIVIGKKKTYDVQFYAEINVGSEDINSKRRNEDEYEEERREKAQRKRLNKEFEEYIKAISTQTQEIKFDIPYRSLFFWGSPNKTNCQIMPTTKCLINITEPIPFILNLEEIEIACFERMMPGLKNFDLVFVFKDYDKAVQRISSIPVEYRGLIRKVINKQNILFAQTTKSFNWTNILQTIKADIPAFVQDGGWNFLMDDENDSEEQEKQDDKDSGFSSVEESEFSKSQGSESDYEGDGDNSVSGSEDDSFEGEELDEEGLSWDEMEEELEKEEKYKEIKKKR